MKKRLYYLFISGLLLIHSPGLLAQEMSEPEKAILVSGAEMKIRELELLLNNLSSSSLSSEALEDYIISSYSEDGKFDRIFYDEQVQIEDDLEPKNLLQPASERISMDVKTYLQNFNLKYQKEPKETVVFDKIQLVDMTSGDTVTLVMSYNSLFKGSHREFAEHVYDTLKRMATIQAVPDDEYIWKYYITGIGYESSMNPDAPVALVEKKGLEDLPAQEQLLNVQLGVNSQKGSPVDKLAFTSGLPEKVKRGKSIALNWNEDVKGATLSLYRDGTKVQDLQQNFTGQQWNWTVNQKPGKNYSVMLYEPASGRKAQTANLQVAPRFPLAVKVGVPLAAAVVIYLLTRPDQTETLADPPGLPAN